MATDTRRPRKAWTNMIDIHSHILPNIDDGSRSVEESLALLRLSAAQGIACMAATPHFCAEDNSPAEFLKRRACSAAELRAHWEPGLPRLLLGAEVCCFEGMSRVSELDALRIEGTELLLLEMPFRAWTDRLIREVLALVGVLTYFLLWPALKPPAAEETVQQSVIQARPGEETETKAPEEDAPYVSPVDFESLWEMNEDIYAWLDIPGTKISYPILQREGDDSYYLRRNSKGEKDTKGAIFTESAYNSKDFTDPVTLVYGHQMRSGSMFGHLQSTYSSLEGLQEYSEIIIYLPEEEIHYQVFAGVPFSKAHILYYYDFSKSDIYEMFLEYIQSIRGIDANVNTEIEVSPENQMLILSTCLQGNNQRRYLVLAKRIDDRTSISNMED